MFLCNDAHECQAQSCASRILCAAMDTTREALEQQCLLVGVDAWAVVNDSDGNSPRVRQALELDRSAIGGEFDCVAEQVDDRAGEQLTICVDQDHCRWRAD